MPISDDAPIIRPGNRAARDEVQINTQVLHLGPGLFKLVATTTDGNFLGCVDLTAVNQDSIKVLAQALNRFAMQQANALVRANGPLPPLDLGGK